MSRHHRDSGHANVSKARRAYLLPLLPMPCLHCGRPVLPEQAWDIGHIVPASQGGMPTVDNLTAVHRACNRRDGGRLGAIASNQARRTAQDIRPW